MSALLFLHVLMSPLISWFVNLPISSAESAVVRRVVPKVTAGTVPPVLTSVPLSNLELPGAVSTGTATTVSPTTVPPIASPELPGSVGDYGTATSGTGINLPRTTVPPTFSPTTVPPGTKPLSWEGATDP